MLNRRFENPRTPVSPKRPKTTTLYKRIREILYANNGVSLDSAARAYIAQMHNGSFIHLKEIIDREEGKVPNRVANADGTNIKTYVGIPVDDQPGAP